MIWCIEDDDGIREIEVYTLRTTGFEARGFADGSKLFDELSKEKPELIILDIMLPGKDGIALLDELRRNADSRDIPVIMATARGMEYDKVKSLDAGADDYLVKPFGMMEMVSRVKAVLRRCGAGEKQSVFSAGGIVLDTESRTVTSDGEQIKLTFKEFELLKLFLSHPGIAFTRERLFDDVWGMDYVGESRTVDMHIRTLRRKLGSRGKMIATVINVGYRLEVTK